MSPTEPVHPPAADLPDHVDVLIIGAGLAGLYLALSAARARTCWVVAPDGPGRGGSSGWAQGGIAAALGPDDSPALHAADTMAVGAGLVDPDIARLLSEAGPAHVRHLAQLMEAQAERDPAHAAVFDRAADGAFHLSLEAAHSRPRVARVTGDQAGKAITRAVVHAAKAQDGVHLRAGWRAVGLRQTADGRVVGAVLRNPAGQERAIAARDVVLATGGLGGLFAVTTTPPQAVGAALALAGAAGAIIADPEFVQFHPTALDVGRDPAPLATEALRGEGAVLVDGAGAPLVDPLGPRDAVARAVHAANMDGRGAFLDARGAVGASFPQRFPTVYGACEAAGLDPVSQPLPVAPAAHYHMGGVAVDAWGRVQTADGVLPGLWAVGEAARTGAHGANRLASNSLLEAVVFAARAAEALGQETAPDTAVDAADTAPTTHTALGDLPPEARTALRTAMARDAGVVRDAAGLTRLSALLAELDTAHGETLEVAAARYIVAGALKRRESRGAHWRADGVEAAADPQPTRLTQAAARALTAGPHDAAA